MCRTDRARKVPTKKPMGFMLKQEVEVIGESAQPYIIQGIHTTADGTRYSIQREGVIRDGHFSYEQLRLFLPRANFYMYVHKSGTHDDTFRDENGYCPQGFRLPRFDEYTRIESSKVELARLKNPPKRDEDGDIEDGDYGTDDYEDDED